jgi:hypothetical protein
MSTLVIPLQKRAPRRFKEMVFLSSDDSANNPLVVSPSNPKQDGTSHCFEILIAVFSSLSIGIAIVALLGVCFIYIPFFLTDPAAAPVLIIPILFSLVFSTIFLVRVIVSGKSFRVLRPGHLLFLGSLCMSLLYTAEWLKLKNILPFEWSIIYIPLYVGGGFLLAALIWFLVLYLQSSFKKGDCTCEDIGAIIFGADSGKASNI